MCGMWRKTEHYNLGIPLRNEQLRAGNECYARRAGRGEDARTQHNGENAQLTTPQKDLSLSTPYHLTHTSYLELLYPSRRG